MRHAGIGRGAVVVMDPRNGDVLALVSVPSYDPNKFIPKIQAKDWDALNQDPTAPMFNRPHRLFKPMCTVASTTFNGPPANIIAYLRAPVRCANNSVWPGK